ncbi:MAG: fumarylacetoacetate hydrolase family protein [Deltaproteobacteria bacterium]|nr:fumarylacetoacetate hydrolase family protein [Deltaproteobacteria bacterium]
MRVVRVIDGELADCSGAPPAPQWALWQSEGMARLLTSAPYAGGIPTDRLVSFSSLQVPVTPTKIVCVGRNYAAHAKELGNDVPTEPLLFLKPPSALLDPGAAIVLPAASQRVEHEGELGIVIGARLKDASEAECRAGIFGITAGNDVTARDLQKKDVQFTRGKGFDTFCPVGPWIETECADLSSIIVETRVDGVVRQHGSTSNMIFAVPYLLSYISRIMTLEPGDLILTGTPEGVGPIVSGNVVEVSISGVGTLSNTVR